RSQAERLGVRVWARHIFYDLAFYFIENAKILNANMSEALEMTIPPEAQTVFTFTAPKGIIAPFAVKEVNSIDAIFRLIEVYGGELDRDNFKVNIKEKVGNENSISIRYGKNIKGLTLTLDAAAIATRIYPVGEGGLLLPERYVEVTENKPVPFDITRKVEFLACSDVESLRIRATQYAKETAVPKINVSIDLFELSKTQEYKGFESLTNANLGDKVSVYHEKLGITTSLRVIRKQLDLLNPMNSKIELGDPLASIIEQLDSDALMDEIKKLLESNKSGVILKKNADVITISTSKYAAMVIGFTTKADANLNCTITLTGKATEATTLNILFSLDGVYYDLKPVQKLAKGDNVLGFSIAMPQVPVGSHSFIIEMWVTNDQFIIEKNNLQLTIEGLHLEGGLSATLPRIECFYAFYYALFLKKLEGFHFSELLTLKQTLPNQHQFSVLMNETEYKRKTAYFSNEQLLSVAMAIKAIYEEFSRLNSLHYSFDAAFVNFDSESEQLSSAGFRTFNRVTITEPILTATGGCKPFDDGVLFIAELPNRTLYENLISVTVKTVKEMI
ncbi:MAG: phage tail spike protein, partial [Oscillospiraceae bacterium]